MHGLLAATILEVFGIVGVIVLIILAAGVTFVAYHIWRFKRAIGQIGEQFKNFGDVMKQGVVPATLGLEPIDDDELARQPELLAAVNELETAGLKRGGLYTLNKMPAARVATLADPARGVTVGAHFVPGYGLNVDVVTMFEDGSALTHRTLQSLGLEHPPQFQSVVMTGATPIELLQEHLASRDATKRPRAIEPEDVADAMEEYHAEEVRWRDGRGGLTPTELRRNLAITGQSADPMQMAMLLASSHAEAIERQRAAHREPFLAASGWSAERWDADGDRLLFVSDDADVESVLAALGELNDEIDLSDAEAERLSSGENIRETFAGWSQTRPDLGIEPIATFGSPPTDAYLVREA
ncbi:hypothetical protein EON77_08645 [bacterium]|nr:MAG: hypothetical protein EON77_08645 [bacterium]